MNYFYVRNVLFVFYLQSLTELNLTRNGIGPDGAQYLSQGLENNTVEFNLLNVNFE